MATDCSAHDGARTFNTGCPPNHVSRRAEIHSTLRTSPARGKRVKLPVLAWYAQRPIADTSARNIPAQRVGREGFEPSTLGLRVVGDSLAMTRRPWRTPMVELGRLGSYRAISGVLVDLVLTLMTRAQEAGGLAANKQLKPNLSSRSLKS